MLFRRKKKPSKKTASTKTKANVRAKVKEKSGEADLVPVHIKTHKDKNGGHPHVIVDNIEENHVSVGLSTHAKKGKNSPNYKLSVNPLGGKEDSYMRRQGTVAPKSQYEKPRNGKMTNKDYKKAKEYGDKAKNKYLEKKRKKK